MTQDEALKILKTGASVFLTGEPGAGKTYTINQYVTYLRCCGVEPAITASTGIAATHIGGMTIHSWSGVGIKNRLSEQDLDKIASTEYIVKRISRTKVLIIDEVSMLHGNMLQMVDAVCREVKHTAEPFGGIQVILVGDFFQLPPIVKEEDPDREVRLFREEKAKSNFAYDSIVWRNLNPVICYITEQHRQDDSDFLSVLSAIRSNSVEQEHMDHIMARHGDFDDMPENTTKLFSKNADVDRLNAQELSRIESYSRLFEMESSGSESLVASLKKGCLSPESLELKTGAVVMFTKNNPMEGFANGTLGTIIDFDEETHYPIVRTREGKRIVVGPMEWAVEENGKVRARIMQIPLRLAWAITVHKSQGMSMDAAIMDLSDVFEFGQGYVALSRVRRLSGLHLLGINDHALKVHPEVLEVDRGFRARSEEAREVFGKIYEKDLQKMHDNFIRASGGVPMKPGEVATAMARPAKRAKKIPTQDETLALWNAGKTITEIAKERNLTEATVCGHIEELVLSGKVNRSDLPRILTPILENALPKIHALFHELGTEKLSPVFARLKGIYSYDEIRRARMLFEK